jgi:hypothetical protein
LNKEGITFTGIRVDFIICEGEHEASMEKEQIEGNNNMIGLKKRKLKWERKRGNEKLEILKGCMEENP